MNKNIWQLLFFALTITSCSTTALKEREGSKEYTMQRVEDKQFLLDSSTTQETIYFQATEQNNLALYNAPDHSIRIFDIASGKELSKIQLYKEGPNATKDAQGFYIQDKDNIWIYQYLIKELLLIDSKGVIKERRKLADKLYPKTKIENTVSPFPLTDMPISMYKDWIILQGTNGVGVEQGIHPACTILYNTKTDEVFTTNRYPSLYGDPKMINKKWDTFVYRAVPYTLSPNNEMVLSYPADDSIRVYNMKQNTTQCHFAGYTVETKPSPINGSTMTALTKHFLEQYQYAGIIYDKYRDLYYRLVVRPIFDYDINDESTQNKPLSIIILNKEYNKVGEFDLDTNAYRYRNIFVSKSGLHINVASDNDDYLNFITLKPIKNENKH